MQGEQSYPDLHLQDPIPGCDCGFEARKRPKAVLNVLKCVENRLLRLCCVLMTFPPLHLHRRPGSATPMTFADASFWALHVSFRTWDHPSRLLRAMKHIAVLALALLAVGDAVGLPSHHRSHRKRHILVHAAATSRSQSHRGEGGHLSSGDEDGKVKVRAHIGQVSWVIQIRTVNAQNGSFLDWHGLKRRACYGEQSGSKNTVECAS